VHELESQPTKPLPADVDDSLEPDSVEPIAPSQPRQREGLPPHYRMRAERHYVDHLSSTVGVPVQLVPISQLSPRPQPATKELDALVRSIRAHGVIQPLLVRRERSAYHVIAGRQRLAAAVAAGLAEVPCIVHQVDEAGAAALQTAENVRGERDGDGPLRASVGARIADGVKEIANDLSRLQTTLTLLRDSPNGFQRAVAVDLVTAQTWRTLWLANVTSMLAGGNCSQGRPRSLSTIVDDIAERFEPECRLSRVRLSVHHHAVSPPHVGDALVGVALTGAIIVTMSLLQPDGDSIEIHTHSIEERGFILEVVQRHSIVAKQTADRFSNQAVSASAAGLLGLGAIALSHATAAFSGAAELIVTDEPGSTLRLTFAHS